MAYKQGMALTDFFVIKMRNKLKGLFFSNDDLKKAEYIGLINVLQIIFFHKP